jgi:hypothetical protein
MKMLRNIIEKAAFDNGLPLKDLTVLATTRDPYRLDTPGNHVLGAWLADALDHVDHDLSRPIHLRGLHYKLAGRIQLPDGSPYSNNDETWIWISEKVAKAARHLGYVPWSSIKDARNAPPRIFTPAHEAPSWRLDVAEVELYLPEPDEMDPSFRLAGDLGRQPYRQAVIAEKQGVEDLLLPICQQLGATLALPAGEVSDSMLYQILREAHEDGRPLVIDQLGDCDPAGHQMAVSTARTVQALITTQFPDLEVRVHAPALTVNQCAEWDLPSTPLKETERRADKWLSAMGREQTELDAAVALAPREFARVVEESLLQYFDVGLARRAREAREKLERAANERLADHLDPAAMAELSRTAQSRFAQIEVLVVEVNAELAIDPAEAGIDTPPLPDVLVGDSKATTEPLLDTSENWTEQTRRLIARKRYAGGSGNGR